MHMKKGILFLLLAGSFTAKSQTLKELLYSGKLKMDSNSVIRKTDDYKSKIDTSQKKEAEPMKTKVAVISADSLAKPVNPKPQPVATGVPVAGIPVTGEAVKDSAVALVVEPTPAKAVAPRTTNKIWKDYTDSLTSVLKTEVLSTKKIKKGSYYVMVDYEIGTDGMVNIINVTATPENALLQEQVKERMLSAPLQVNPYIDSTNNPKKVKRRYSFVVTKD
jgi:hypothetical protein